MNRALKDILSPEYEQAENTVSGHFFPPTPQRLEDTGLNLSLIEDLICKILLSHGSLTGRELAEKIALPRTIFKDLLYELKQRLILAHLSTSGMDDFEYTLTESGRQKALLAREQSNYLGTAPVPFADYL
ncbi:MAG: AAA family ATPase, partial [Candidatus Electrothrix sp. ATG2]|nr:AAA family ATPase [Candidatus Electrothrix sp. ATG2]